MNQLLSPSERAEKEINERAWLLWNKVTQIADEIWDVFENYFVDKIISENDHAYEENDDFNEDEFKS
jgi:hypothetical protein